MKKIIALALALIMALSMASVAFAAATTYKLSTDGVTDDSAELSILNFGFPGETYKFKLKIDDPDTVPGITDVTEINTKNFKVSYNATKGGALIDSIELTKEGGVLVVKLKENYTITKVKSIKGTVTLTGKGNGYKDIVFELKTGMPFGITNDLKTIEVYEDVEDAKTYEAANNTLYQCPEDENGYVKFNANALLSATLNMVSLEKAFMYNDESMIEELAEKFPEADIECYNFGGTPTFKNAAKFTLQADYADQYYIYSYANGKLAAQDAEWNSIEGVYEWETKTPTSYVISDVELVAAADDAATTNPDTGANDVVGVAAALAVVSLVAAGAVSLKK